MYIHFCTYVRIMFLKIFVLFLATVCIEAKAELDWWQKTVLYQIYPRSFKDSNGDGVGDLKGIEQQANYFVETGIDTVWLSPIFKSPMVDMGYDVSDFKEIAPIFGTMDDLISLQKKLKSLGIKLVLDFVPNHTSDEHDWFKKSIKKIDPYTNYYVWRDPKSWINETTPVPPNNWVSCFEGSSWKYVPERKQFYLHQFAEKQPDLNFRSRELVEEMKSTLVFWLEKGIDGIRVDSVPYLFENKDFLDEPSISNATVNNTPSWVSFNHTYTRDLPESYAILREFRELFDSYKKKDGHTRVLVTEAYGTVENTIKWYGNYTQPIAHIPFNFFLLTDLNDISNAEDLNATIHKWIDNMPNGTWANWVLGNHDNSRIATRFGASAVDSMNMLLLLLPGTGTTYNGDEMGMQDTRIRWDQTTDVNGLNVGPKLYRSYSRDPQRTPVQWNSSIHAGFSKTVNKTWLPVNPNYYHTNVEVQKQNPRSHYNVYRALLKLRSNEVMLRGDLTTYAITKWVFAFTRKIPDEEMFLIVINLNNEEEYMNLNTSIPDLPETLNVYIPSINSEYSVGDKLNSENIGFKMRPKSALVLQAILKRPPPSNLFNSASNINFTIVLPVLLTIIIKFLSI